MSNRPARNAYRKRKTFETEMAELFVTKNRRSIRLTVTTHLDRFVNPIVRPIEAGTGFIDLTDEQIDRLVRRLQAIRGGRKRTHTSQGNRRTP